MRLRVCFLAVVGAAVWSPCGRADDDYERAPIHYSKTTPKTAVSRLQAELDAGKQRLAFDKERGYLPALLKALNVPESSQMLVFSKTSLQRSRIGPKTPRAIYFSDEAYIGFCQAGQVLEISAVDAELGAVFYTLDQERQERPKFVRQTDSCLLCHGSSQTRYVPGHLVRSVFADGGGEAILSLGTTRVDQTTPFERRWGGWYVTGTHGKQKHLGNLIVRNRGDRDAIANNNPAGQNITDLTPFCDTGAYLTPHSDIVALMVLEHQAEGHNLLAQAGMTTRRALFDQAQLNKELGAALDYVSDGTMRRITSVAEPLVRHLLFSGEARLTEKVKGTSAFTKEFAKRGPRDKKGRSLRDFDLERRLFKYPCSYLIYSEAFAKLPRVLKDHVYERIHDALTGRDYTGRFVHLSVEDRQAILEIVRATKDDLPECWRK